MKSFPASYKQNGAAAVEFALVAMVFFILLLGVVEMGRVLFTWNAAVEATRYGARVAVVCDWNDKTPIVNRMRRIMPNLTADNVNVDWLLFSGSSSCNQSTCQQVRVSISGFQVTTHIPVVGALLNVPPFFTTLPRESLESVNGAGEANPVCT